MSNNRNARAKTPSLPKVQKVELPERHLRLRAVLFAVLLVVGVGALVFGLVRYLSTGSGWREITAETKEENLAGEIFFYYDISGNGTAAGTEYRQVRAVYTQASVYAYRVFHATEEFAGVYNLAYLNRHVNETVTVDAALYRALEQIVAAGDRTVFRAPYYDNYKNLFFCTDNSQITDFDPLLNSEVAAYFAEIAAFVNDPNAVSLALYGDNRAGIRVSDKYLSFARANGIETFVDFFRLRNAFTVDYLAEKLTESGYVNGALSSYDGYVRNMDPRGSTFSLTMYHREGTVVDAGGTLVYDKPISVVTMRDYALDRLDSMDYYAVDENDVRHPYINSEGYCQAAIPELVGVSETKGCAEIALRMAPIYINDVFRIDNFRALTAEGIGGIVCLERTFYITDPTLTVTNLYSESGVSYRTVVVQN